MDRLHKKRRLNKRKAAKVAAKSHDVEISEAPQPQEHEDIRELEFEDPGDDEWESETDAIYHSGSSVAEEVEDWEDFENLRLEEKDGNIQLVHDPNYAPMEESSEESEREVWKGDPRQLRRDEYLDYENEAYDLFYRSSIDWSCLSLDTFPGPELCTGFPYTVYVVAGSQAADGNNRVYVMKWKELYKTKHDDKESSSDEEEIEEEGDEAVLEFEEFPHEGVVNRIRSYDARSLVATWSDLGSVSIYDVSKPLGKLYSGSGKGKGELLKRFNYDNEGYALCWGYDGVLYAGGDALNVYAPSGSSWEQVARYAGHKGSIEDIQRSPVEPTVLASCSCDRSIKIWDTRTAQHDSQITLPNAHSSDINVISWNTQETTQIASGSDDSSFKIWDLRFAQKQMACIQWHSDSITSICWNPQDSTELAVASADDRITVWDLAVEAEGEVEDGIPPQLLFIHQGQEDIKELTYHPQYSFIISTACNGFHLFKPSINLDE